MNSTSPDPNAPLAGGPPALPSIPAVDNTLGAILIGTFVSLAYVVIPSFVVVVVVVVRSLLDRLYGLMAHQAYRYYQTYPYDKPLLKIYVRLPRSLAFVTVISPPFSRHRSLSLC